MEEKDIDPENAEKIRSAGREMIEMDARIEGDKKAPV